MWQKCPICNGGGKVENFITAVVVYRQCPTCQGKRIISDKNGLPPGDKPEKHDKLNVVDIKLEQVRRFLGLSHL